MFCGCIQSCDGRLRDLWALALCLNSFNCLFQHMAPYQLPRVWNRYERNEVQLSHITIRNVLKDTQASRYSWWKCASSAHFMKQEVSWGLIWKIYIHLAHSSYVFCEETHMFILTPTFPLLFWDLFCLWMHSYHLGVPAGRMSSCCGKLLRGFEYAWSPDPQLGCSMQA